MRSLWWSLVLAALLGGAGAVVAQDAAEVKPEVKPEAKPAAKPDDKSPLDKIRIEAKQSAKRGTENNRYYYSSYYSSSDFKKSVITIRPTIRNDGKAAAEDLRITTYLIGRMAADARMYRVIAKSTQQASAPLKKDVALEPLMATVRYVTGGNYKRGARDCAWLVVVRDADGLLVGTAVSKGQEAFLSILKTIEKADCGTRWREGVSYFNIKGEIAHAIMNDFDYDYYD